MDHFGIHTLKKECSLVLNKVEVKMQFCDDYTLKLHSPFVTKERPLVHRASSEELDEVGGFGEKRGVPGSLPGAPEAVGSAGSAGSACAPSDRAELPAEPPRLLRLRVERIVSSPSSIHAFLLKCHVHETTDNILF